MAGWADADAGTACVYRRTAAEAPDVFAASHGSVAALTVTGVLVELDPDTGVATIEAEDGVTYADRVFNGTLTSPGTWSLAVEAVSEDDILPGCGGCGVG